MKSEIKWPAWVWHENDAAKLDTLDALYESFGRGRASFVVRSILKAASLMVSPKIEPWIFLPEMWQELIPAERRRAWRWAMERLGYTEVCDA